MRIDVTGNGGTDMARLARVDGEVARRAESTSTNPDPLVTRGLDRPAVDPAEAEIFGRPAGVGGSFSPDARPVSSARVISSPPPAAALASAFGRPPGQTGGLQRSPDDVPGEDIEPVADDDPWRDPAAGAVLGPPALREHTADRLAEGERSGGGQGARIGIRELLFGRRLTPKATAAFFAAVLLVGAVGGLLGRLTAEGPNPLNSPDVTLAQVEPGKERAPDSIAAVARRVVPAVVSVEARKGSQTGTGSGVVIDGAGYVLTNNHVVEMAASGTDARLETVFHDGKRAQARLVGRDPKNDLAVLKVEVAGLVVAPLGRSEQLAVGDTVIAIGSPLGLSKTVTSGIVSALHRPVQLSPDGLGEAAAIDAVQTDAAINHGNSGGPLVDSSGAVIGINTAIYSTGGPQGGSIGLGFAIPIDHARRIADALIKDGQVKHPLFGVNVKSVTEGTSDGAQVQNVKQGGPAEKAGIKEGDVIIKVGDRRISGSSEMHVAIAQRQIGETVPIVIVRQGRELTVRVTLASD